MEKKKAHKQGERKLIRSLENEKRAFVENQKEEKVKNAARATSVESQRMPIRISTESKGMAKWKPAVPGSILVFIAGAVWAGIGIMLVYTSYSWLRMERPAHALPATAVGLACALVIHHFGFLRLVDRNLARILPVEGKRCVFSFIPWKSYILITVMILLGFLLRHSPIPRLYLSPLYIAIGTALMLSSIRYFRYFIRIVGKP